MNKLKKMTFYLVLLAVFYYGCQEKNGSGNYPKILKEFINEGSKSILPDFSFAGYHYGEEEIPNIESTVFDVTLYGAKPNDGLDDTKAIQNAVDAAGAQGGGVVFFPCGTFHVNMDTSVTDIIQINYSNIVMRGSGTGMDGTIIFSGSSTDQSEENSPWLTPFVFHTGLNLHGTDNFYSVREEPVFASIKSDLKKGSDILVLAKTDGLKEGDIIVVCMQNTTDDGDLMKELMKPLKFDHFQLTYIEAGIRRDASFQYPMEVKAVLNDSVVQLYQPIRRGILLKFKPFVAKMSMLKNIGIENFRFESAWDGKYKHHGNREMDYGWGAVGMHRVAHGWIRNIVIDNYTQTIHLVNSRNVTVSDITITGGEGHYGPKMYNSCDNLVKNIKIKAKRTHGPGLEGCCFGNVYTNIKFMYPSPIDFHGISGEGFCPPMYNLYENINNVTRVAGGGAPQNIPHAGEYNVLWGLEMAGYDDDGFNELFYSWIWRDPKRFKNDFHIDCHKQYLRTIVVGVHNSKKTLSIEHKSNDRTDEWIYVEGLNENMHLPSLYETQLQTRLAKKRTGITRQSVGKKMNEKMVLDMESFHQEENLNWQTVFFDSCTTDWRKRWFLDGGKATITHSEKGMDFMAGPVRMDNASHAVLWTKQSFEGDIKIEYEYTKLDDQYEAVTIIYIQAMGNEALGFDKDIAKWANKRMVPKMKTYFNNMDLYHISYAAYNVGGKDPNDDYIRARRYMPEKEKGLQDTDLKPDYFKTGLFKKGVTYKITIIKKDDDLFMFIRNNERQLLCYWETSKYPPLTKGRIGLRHMWTRGARYKDFKISQLKVR